MKVFGVVFFIALLASTAFGESVKGQWTLGPSDSPAKIHLFLHADSPGQHTFSSLSDWDSAELQGLARNNPARHDVRFRITRDAGAIDGDVF